MTTYYIDPVAGSNANAGTSPAAPIQTPFKAGFLAALVASDIVRFKRTTTLTCTTRIDGNVSGVTYRAYYNPDGSDDPTKPRPIIDGNGVRQIWGMATDRTGIKFYDLDFTNWGDGGGVASFAIANATTGDSNSIVTGVEVHGCRFYGSNSGTAETTAIHIFGADCIVEGCEFWDISDDAIWAKGDRVHIYNNHVTSINTSGLNLGDCIQLGGRSDNFSVHDNYLDGSAGANKQCFIISGASAGTGGTFENNVCIGGNNVQTGAYTDQPNSIIRKNYFLNGTYSIFANAAATITGNVCESTYAQNGGIYVTAAGCTVANNTVNWTGAGVGGVSGTGSGIYLEAGEVSSVRNNILVGCGRGVRLDESVATESYNAFYNCTTNVKGISADPALGTGSFVGNPQLAHDYMPRNSALWTAGLALGYTDLYGITFVNTIGAVQYQSAQATAAYPKFLYDNRFLDAAPTASTTATGYDVDNLTDMRPYSFWQPTALPATITVDCAVATAADFAAICGHDLYDANCTVEIRASTDNFSASDVLLVKRTPTSNEPFILPFASASYRYWRIKITGTQFPTLAIAVIGVALPLPRRHQIGFDPTARSARSLVNRSVGGYPLGKVTAYEEWSQQISIDVVTWAWIRDTWTPAWKAYLRDEPFLYAWDSTDHPREVYLVQAGSDFKTPTISGNYAGLEFTLTGVAN